MEYKFTEANYEAEVMSSDIPVMIDFYADWCGPCKMMGPVVAELATEYEGKAKIGKCNVDDNPAIAAQFGVMSIPTFVFLKGGQMVAKQVGAISKKELTQMLEQVLA